MMTQPTAAAPQLLPRVASGDPEAVQACLKRYGPLVWSLAKKLWNDVAALDDVVQEIFIDVWKSAGRFDPERASEATFIATIARRRIIDRRRRADRTPPQENIEEASVAVPDAGLSSVDLGDEARRARETLDQLKPEQRRVILMAVVDGLTHQEIATQTGLPLGTVKSHIRRGLDRAAQLMRPSDRGVVS